MTDATPLASEQITQEDREAAAAYFADTGDQLRADHARSGNYDLSAAVRAFARHRIAALSASPAPSGQSVADMAAFGASEAACYLYPGEDQQAERAAFCEGAAHAVSTPSQRLDAATVERWQSMDSAPRDGTEFWALSDDVHGTDLSPFASKCAWHPDAGFCTDELREPILWRALATEPHQHGAGNGEKHGG